MNKQFETIEEMLDMKNMFVSPSEHGLSMSNKGVHSILVLHTTTNPARFIYNNNLQGSEFEIDESDIDGCYRINFFSWNSDEKFLEDKTVKEVYYE